MEVERDRAFMRGDPIIIAQGAVQRSNSLANKLDWTYKVISTLAGLLNDNTG